MNSTVSGARPEVRFVPAVLLVVKVTIGYTVIYINFCVLLSLPLLYACSVTLYVPGWV